MICSYHVTWVALRSTEGLKKEQRVRSIAEYRSIPNMDIVDYSQYDFPNEIWFSLPEWEIAVKIAAFVPILVVGLLGNALMVTIIVRNRALQTPTNLLLANMSAADFLTLAICPVLFMFNNFYQEFQLGKFGCLAEGFLEGAFLVTAVFNLCAVSYDRLTAIVLPTETRLTVRGAKIVMVLTWVTGGVFATPLAIFRFYKVWIYIHYSLWKNVFGKSFL